jgi:hypothetical protein
MITKKPNSGGYKSKMEMQNNFIIFHPFIKIEAESNMLGLQKYSNWHEGCINLNLTSDLSDFHIAILHYYFGLAKFGDEFTMTSESHYNSHIMPLYDKFKNTIDNKLLPLSEQLNEDIFKLIIEASTYQKFEVDTMYGTEVPDELEKNDLIKYYKNYKGWEVKSLDRNFYIKSDGDDVITIVSYNENKEMDKLLSLLANSIDIIPIS